MVSDCPANTWKYLQERMDKLRKRAENPELLCGSEEGARTLLEIIHCLEAMALHADVVESNLNRWIDPIK